MNIIVTPVIRDMFLYGKLLLYSYVSTTRNVPIRQSQETVHPYIVHMVKAGLSIPRTPFPSATLDEMLHVLALQIRPRKPGPVLSTFHNQHGSINLDDENKYRESSYRQYTNRRYGHRRLRLKLFSYLGKRNILRSHVQSFHCP